MPFCIHYNMSGHTFEKCYKLHGYPPGYKPKGKNNASANQVSSHLSNGAENFASGSNLCPISKAQCEQLLAFLSSGLGSTFGGDGSHHAANVRASSSVASVEGHSSGTFDVFSSQSQVNSPTNLCSDLMLGTSSNFPFSPNLSHSIFSAKNVNRDAFRNSDQVIDTGATDHMVHSIAVFTSITATLNTFVNLPNGESTLVTHIGTVKIS